MFGGFACSYCNKILMADKHVPSNNTGLVIRKNDGKNEEKKESFHLYMYITDTNNFNHILSRYANVEYYSLCETYSV